MKCRVGCGACCIAPSISSPIPGMPGGKKAGERCIHLTGDNKCGIFEHPQRPEICNKFSPTAYICGNTFEEAMNLLENLEIETGIF